MTAPRKDLADTAAVAKLYDVEPGTVRSWASRERWTPHGTRRNRLWDLDDIEAKHTNKEGTDACPASPPRPNHTASGSPRPPRSTS